jgi:hypothetical protein
MIRFVSAVTSAVLACSIAIAALADASSDLYRAIDRTEATHAYHLVIATQHGTFAGDYIYPSTTHMTMAGMEVINVNGKMYMRQGGGSWQTLPGGSGVSDSDALQLMKLHRQQFRASDLGMKVVDGGSLHAYHVDDLKTGRPQTVYVDGGGRIVRVDAPSVSIRFSHFGEPAHIVAPI